MRGPKVETAAPGARCSLLLDGFGPIGVSPALFARAMRGEVLTWADLFADWSGNA